MYRYTHITVSVKDNINYKYSLTYIQILEPNDGIFPGYIAKQDFILQTVW